MCASRRQRRRAVRGTLILTFSLAAALLIFFLDDLIRATQPTYAVVITYPAAPRLVPGAPVWLAGRPVGAVTGIDMLPPTDAKDRIAVTVRISRDVQSLVREDSPARLMSPRLLADPVVDISPGSLGAPVLRPGDTIRGTPPPELDGLTRKALAFVRSFDSMMIDLRSVDALANQRRRALQQLQYQLAFARFRIDQLSRQLAGGTLGALAQDPTLRADLERARRTFDAIGGRLAEFATDTAATDRAGAGPALQGLTQNLRELQSSIADLEALLDQSGGFLPRLARDSALVKALVATRVKLDSLIAVTRRNPLRFLF